MTSLDAFTDEQKEYIRGEIKKRNRVINAIFGVLFALMVLFGSFSVYFFNEIENNSDKISAIVTQNKCEDKLEVEYLVEFGDYIDALVLAGVDDPTLLPIPIDRGLDLVEEYSEFNNAREDVRELYIGTNTCEPEKDS